MWRSRTASACVAAVPGLVLAVAGLLHPHHLTSATAERWWVLHVGGLLVFPLVGLALVSLVRGRADPVACLVRVTAYVYATFYTALDVVSGIAAGFVTDRLGPGVERPEEVTLLFRIGTPLGEVGSYALLACVAVVAVDQLRRHGLAGAPGILLVPGAWLMHSDHIFAPEGAVGMLLVGLATGWLAWVAGDPHRATRNSSGHGATLRVCPAS